MKKPIQPVIKWAGGKRRLAPTIAECILGSGYRMKGTYYEPFLGGAALMLFLRPMRAVGIDQNPELINFYNVVKNNPNELFECLSQDFAPFHSEQFYYAIRAWDQRDDFHTAFTDVQRAARFVYLNKTCFNGIWRVNSSGHNNVPWNHSEKASLPSLDRILALSNYLSSHVTFVFGDYKDVVDMAQKGDLVYFDPPYDVEENQSNFTEYTKKGFTRSDQTELKSLCDELIDKGVWVAISNSNTSFIRELYKKDDSYSLYRVIDESKLRLARTIGAKSSSRGYVNELLIIGKPMDGRKKRFLKKPEN